MARTIRRCGNCGKQLKQAATGRPPKWCSRGCRQRAYESRRLDAAERAGREQAIQAMRGRTYLA